MPLIMNSSNENIYPKFQSKLTSRFLLVVLWLITIPLLLMGQGGPSYSIFGPTSVAKDAINTFHINDLNNVVATSWSSTGASPQNPTPYTQSGQIKADFKWTSNGTKTINLIVTDASGNQSVSLTVYVGPPPTPPNPTVQSTSCGSAVLNVSGTKPDGISWYWQGKNSNGTSTGNGSGSTYTANQGAGTYYLRTRWNAADNAWSNSSSSVYASIQSSSSVSGLTVSGGGAFCGGTNEITLNSGTSFVSGVDYDLFRNGNYFGRRKSADEQVLGAQHILSYGTQGTGTYTIKLKNSACSYVQVGNSAVITTKSPTPITISASPSLLENCPGTAVTLTAGGGSGYSWSTGQQGSSITVYPTSGSSDVYTVTATDSGCGQTGEGQILVTGTNTVGTVSAPSGTGTRCAGAGTDNYSASAADANSYTWSLSPVEAGTINNSGTVTWNDSYVGTVTVSVTANGNCGSTSTGNKNVLVKALPDITDMSINGSTSCSLGPQTNIVHLRMLTTDMSNLVNPFPTNQTYQLIRINGGSETNVGVTKTWQDAGSAGTSYIIEFTNMGSGQFNVRTTAGTCSVNVASSPVDVIVNTAEVAYVPNVREVRNQTLCPGDEALLVLPTGSPSTKLYNADIGGFSFPSTNVGNEITVDLSGEQHLGGPFTYYVGLPSGSCVDEARIPVTVDYYATTPEPYFPAADKTACDGEQITFKVQSPVASYAYHWYDNTNTELQESPATSITFNLAVGSYQYFVEAVSSEGCTSPSRTALNGTINGLPTATIDPILVTVCPEIAPQLAAITEAGNSVKWFDKSNTLISTDIQPSFSLIAAGVTQKDYTLEVTHASNGCPNEDEVTVTKVSEDTYRPETVVEKLSNTSYRLDVKNPAAGYTFFWGDQTEGSSPMPRTESNAGIYDLLARNTSTGCLSQPGTAEILDLQPHIGKTIGLTNHVRAFAYKRSAAELTDESDINQVAQSTEYIDGLGRSIQSVAKRASKDTLDMVAPFEYDDLNRQPRSYLPYEATSNDGERKNLPYDEHHDFYNTNPPANIAGSYYGFNYQNIERSALARVDEQYAPGEPWVGKAGSESAQPIKSTRSSNDPGLVYQWEIVNDLPETTSSTHYGANSLYQTVTTDEASHQTMEFTDKQGQVVLKRVQVHESGTSPEQWADTYYVYDDFGNLRFVLPPKVFESGLPAGGFVVLNAPGWIQVPDHTTVNAYQGASYSISDGKKLTLGPGFSFSSSSSETFHAGPERTEINHLDDLAFQYRYDHRNRMIAKKVPGAAWVYMIYDKRDRLVLTQDGNQRINMQWAFTKYDALNRPIMTGIYTDSQSLDDLRTAAAGHTVWSETKTTDAVGYSYNLTYPTTVADSDLLTITYYDDYSFITNTDWDVENLIWPSQSCGCESTVKGQVTGAKTRNLASDTWLNSSTHYDDRYRVRQVFTENDAPGIDETTNTYSFNGNLLTTFTTHHGHDTVMVKRTFVYDHADRLSAVYHSLNGADSILLVANTYNEIGELTNKKLHSDDVGTTSRQSVDYNYNIRGWLTKINDPANATADQLFGMQLLYDNAPSPQYNGNIGQMKWSSPGDNVQEDYAFSYDPLNRLTAANYTGAISKDYDVNSISYDLNGNILGLQRDGKTGEAAYGLVDGLTYQYFGNQLTNVDDSEASTVGVDKNFKDGNEGSGKEYFYDPNGNMIKDANKGIADIDYNYLNLPEKITFETVGDSIKYIYDAAGIKLSQEVYKGGVLDKTTDYMGEFIYENDTLQLIQHEEGRITPGYDLANPDWHYQYHLKDHLGNVRLTFTSEPDTWDYPATFETEDATIDNLFFTNIEETRHTDALSDHDDPNYPGVENEVARVNGTRIVGPTTTIHVGPGDQVSAEVYAYYTATSGNSNTVTAAALIGALSSAYQATTGFAEASAVFTQDQTNILAAASGGSQGDVVPAAYLNYLYFDEDHALIRGGYVVIGEGANTHQLMELTGLPVFDEVGYVMVYVSCEGTANYVDFDDLTVTHTESAIVQGGGYYPGGLSFGSYKRVGNRANKYLYNGKELQDDLDLNLFDYGARFYDPQLLRWHAIDPHADRYTNYSPYNYVYNNFPNAVDRDGRDGILIVFPDYPIAYQGESYDNLGHAGVLLIDNKTGLTKYYEYGRYDTSQGEVNHYRISDVVIGPDGKPTSESLAVVFQEISEASGKSGRIEGAYVESDDFEAMREYAQNLFGLNNDPDREGYDIFGNNCGTFACDVLNQDGEVADKAPGILDPRPNSIIDEYQDVFDGVSYDPETGAVKYSVNKSY